jgi:GxxExxY protein
MKAITNEQTFLYGELTHAIIGAAMEMHKVLGPGFLESVYEKALTYELTGRGIAFERQKPLQVRYKTILAGDFIVDVLVENKVLLELKAIRMLTKADEAQLINYLRATGIRIGLLLNFGAPSLEYWRRAL